MTDRDDQEDKHLAALYRSASTEEPSPGLDARILAAARGSASPPKTGTTSWVNRWKMPVALAATVLLTTTLTLMVREQEVDPSSVEDPVARESQRTVQPAPPPAAAKAAPKSPPLPDQARPEAKRDSASRPTDADQAARSREAPAAAKVEAAAPAADELRAETPKDQPLLERSRPQAEAAPPALAPAFTPPHQAAAAASASRPMAAPAPAPGRADRAERSAQTGQVAGRLIERSPEQWLAEIRKLKVEGRTAEAEASLAEFRKRYPEYRLPEDLKQP